VDEKVYSWLGKDHYSTQGSVDKNTQVYDDGMVTGYSISCQHISAEFCDEYSKHTEQIN